MDKANVLVTKTGFIYLNISTTEAQIYAKINLVTLQGNELWVKANSAISRPSWPERYQYFDYRSSSKRAFTWVVKDVRFVIWSNPHLGSAALEVVRTGFFTRGLPTFAQDYSVVEIVMGGQDE